MLDYDLNDRGSLSRYEFLYRSIRDDVIAGVLAADDRLPSKRTLASKLDVSIVTVEQAYAQLIAEGYVYTRPRSGYFVCALPEAPAPAGPHKFAEAQSAAASEEPALVADLSGSPTAARPEAARIWGRALKATLASESEAEVFATPPSQGTPRLRNAIVAHLRRSRGMEVDPDRIVVGAGAQVLYNIIVQLLGRGSVFAVEDPGYPLLTSAYRANGAEVAHIPLDAEGICTNMLAASGASVVHVMPSHQFPTGRVTGIARRYELLSWANAEPERYIVEDDYDCEFRLAGRPIPPLASIDAQGRVIYTNTFSKSLGAGLRLAYLVLPNELEERYVRELGFYSSTVSSVQQVTLARLLESGDYERHVARERTRQRALRDELVDALKASSLGPRLQVEEADSGLHFVLAIDCSLNEAQVAASALSRGLKLAPLSGYASDPQNREYPDGLRRFVIQYGALEPASIREAVDILCAVVG